MTGHDSYPPRGSGSSWTNQRSSLRISTFALIREPPPSPLDTTESQWENRQTLNIP